MAPTDIGNYREVAAPPALSSHVACLWWRKGTPARVLPDGCVDLVWTGADLIVAGPATRALVPEVPPGEPKLGVRFRIGAAGVSMGLSADELLNRSPPLAEVWAEGEEVAERVAEAPSVRAELTALVSSVEARLASVAAPDPLVRAAVRALCRPRVRMGTLCDRLGISQRQLRRRFHGAVGYHPMMLARVLRLQRFLALARNADGLARIAAEAGYADQPHLTRDCVELAGLPAAALLANGAGPAGERLTPG